MTNSYIHGLKYTWTVSYITVIINFFYFFLYSNSLKVHNFIWARHHIKHEFQYFLMKLIGNVVIPQVHDIMGLIIKILKSKLKLRKKKYILKPFILCIEYSFIWLMLIDSVKQNVMWFLHENDLSIFHFLFFLYWNSSKVHNFIWVRLRIEHKYECF